MRKKIKTVINNYFGLKQSTTKPSAGTEYINNDVVRFHQEYKFYYELLIKLLWIG